MKSRGITTLIISIVIVIVIIISNYTFGLELGKKTATFLSPVGVVVNNTGLYISEFFGGIWKIGTLQKENNELNNKLNSAITEIARLTEFKKENDSLRRELGFKQSTSLDLVPGYVAYFDPSLRDGITVRVEDISSIEVGNVVLSEGFLIGKVAKIDGKNIQILLTTDSMSAIPATVQNKPVTGIAKGKIGNGLTMEQVPQSDTVIAGDMIVTSGLGGDTPKGLIIGKVDEIQKISGSIFQSIILQPMLDFTKIERVMIAR